MSLLHFEQFKGNNVVSYRFELDGIAYRYYKCENAFVTNTPISELTIYDSLLQNVYLDGTIRPTQTITIPFIVEFNEKDPAKTIEKFKSLQLLL